MRLFLILLFFWAPAHAELVEVKLTPATKIPMSRSVSDNKWLSGKKSLNPLEQIRLSVVNRDWMSCLSLIQAQRGSYLSLGPWMSLQELQCAVSLKELKPENMARVKAAIQRVEKEKAWLLKGPASELLRNSLVEARFVLLTSQVKHGAQEAWPLAEEILSYTDWMDADQKADAFRIAGELAFVRQNMTVARRYLERSLENKEDEKLRKKIAAIDTVTQVNKEPALSSATLKQGYDENLEASEKELALQERMKTALRSGDLVAAIEDGIDLIEQFGGGTRAAWAADRIWDSYLSVAGKTDENYQLLRQRLVKLMLKADGRRLNDWCVGAFKVQQYNDAVEFGRKAMDRMEEFGQSTALLWNTGRAAQFSGQDKLARKMFSLLIEKHAGTTESKQALFQLGLLAFRAKEFTVAVAHFERLLVLPGTSDWELENRYWLWRSLQNVDAGRAKKEADYIILKFPFSYYGLRAAAELNSGVIDLPYLKNNSKLTASLWLTGEEKKGWDRIQVLLKGGWWEAAQKELEVLPHPKDPVARGYLAQAWAAAFGYPRAIRLLNDAWDIDSRLRETAFFSTAFPKEFSQLVDREAKKNGLDPDWVRGLIRQESAWNITARSRSNALGLMQMIPPTAEEVAADLKVKNLQLPEDLFDPEKNLVFCTHYLAKVLRQFQGHLPVALASYNAGPTRIRRWLEGRKIDVNLSSDPLNEIWIEELPWSETRFYVKAILRNILLYRVLDRGKVSLTDPIWKSEPK